MKLCIAMESNVQEKNASTKKKKTNDPEAKYAITINFRLSPSLCLFTLTLSL